MGKIIRPYIVEQEDMLRYLAYMMSLFIMVSMPVKAEDKAVDPWEKTNRKIYAFNKTADTYVLKPVAQAYRRITPQIVDNSITRFFDNLKEPLVAVNNGLQGKGQAAAIDLSRFVVNTVSSLGFADVAQQFNLSKHDEDFGQTFGKWGASTGPYLVLPFLGSSSVRDALAKPFDMAVDPRMAVDSDGVKIGLTVLQVVDLRADLIPMEKVIEGDEYLLLRDVYLQRREFLVQDGKIKDTFMDDDEENTSGSSP